MRRLVSWFPAAGVSLALLLGAAPAHAAEIIDFGTGAAGFGGQMKYDGTGGSLIGSGILLGVMTASGTPLNGGVHPTTGPAACGIALCAELDFTTGALSSYSNGVYSFNPGGTFTITGGIPGGVGNQPLVWGTFTSDSVLDGGQLKLLAATGSDNVSSDLLNYLGIAPGTPFEFMGSVIGVNFLPGLGGAFNALALSSDFSSVSTPTPEPSSLALLFVGAGILAASSLRRRTSPSTAAAVR